MYQYLDSSLAFRCIDVLPPSKPVRHRFARDVRSCRKVTLIRTGSTASDGGCWLFAGSAQAEPHCNGSAAQGRTAWEAGHRRPWSRAGVTWHKNTWPWTQTEWTVGGGSRKLINWLPSCSVLFALLVATRRPRDVSTHRFHRTVPLLFLCRVALTIFT